MGGNKIYRPVIGDVRNGQEPGEKPGNGCVQAMPCQAGGIGRNSPASHCEKHYAGEATGINRLLSLWNYSLSVGISEALGAGADAVFLEVGRVALDKLRSEEHGIELTRETPLDTINSVYGFFTEMGYFRGASARDVSKASAPDIELELHEQWNIDFHTHCWAVPSGQAGSHACFCYNVMKSALNSGFGLTLQLLDANFRGSTAEIFIRAALKPYAG